MQVGCWGRLVWRLGRLGSGVVVMLCLDEWRDLHRGDVASACLNAVFVGGLCVRCVVL